MLATRRFDTTSKVVHVFAIRLHVLNITGYSTKNEKRKKRIRRELPCTTTTIGPYYYLTPKAIEQLLKSKSYQGTHPICKSVKQTSSTWNKAVTLSLCAFANP